MKIRRCAATVSETEEAIQPVFTSQNAIFNYSLSISASHRKGVSIALSSTVLSHSVQSSAAVSSLGVGCPGLFCPTQSQDGILTRIRVPGGQISRSQLETLLKILEAIEATDLLITNRANLQWRSPRTLNSHELQALQSVGLAADPAIDHLRNILVSPLAGFDPTAIANTVPIVEALNQWISQATHLAELSAKFSIGVDGGEALSVRDRLNDIWFVAESENLFRLCFGMGEDEANIQTSIVTDDCVGWVAAIAQVYLDESDRLIVQPDAAKKHRRSQKPRLRDVIRSVGVDRFLQRCDPPKSPLVRGTLKTAQTVVVSGKVSTSEESDGSVSLRLPVPPLPRGARGDRHLEITLPLGYFSIAQLRSLIDCFIQFELFDLRLTPWQSLIIPGIAIDRVSDLTTELISAQLDPNPNHPAKGIVACSGRSGCAAAATHAKEHALGLIQLLQSQTTTRLLSSIHISGCEKRCAQKKDGEMTLIGIDRSGEEFYEVWLNGQRQPMEFTPDEAIDWVLNGKVLTHA